MFRLTYIYLCFVYDVEFHIEQLNINIKILDTCTTTMNDVTYIINS